MDALPCRRHGRRLLFGRGKRGGRLVARLPIPLSSYLSSSSSSSSCFFSSPTPLLFALRCASSCAGPGGLTERNTCREKQRNRVRNIHLTSQMCMVYVGKIQEMTNVKTKLYHSVKTESQQQRRKTTSHTTDNVKMCAKAQLIPFYYRFAQNNRNVSGWQVLQHSATSSVS